MKIWRGAVILLGLLFSAQSLGWVLDPQGAAERLGMPLLDGMARSTQVGDFTAFFFTLGCLILHGSRPGHAKALYGGVLLLGSAAVFRTLAWLLHGAAFAGPTIGIEVVSAVVLAVAAKKLATDLESPGSL